MNKDGIFTKCEVHRVDIHRLTYKIFYSYKRTLYTSTYTVELSLLPHPVGTAGTLSLSLSPPLMLFQLTLVYPISHPYHIV